MIPLYFYLLLLLMFVLSKSKQKINKYVSLENKLTKKTFHLTQTILSKRQSSMDRQRNSMTAQSCYNQRKKINLVKFHHRYDSNHQSLFSLSSSPTKIKNTQSQLSPNNKFALITIPHSMRSSKPTSPTKKFDQIQKWDNKIKNWREKSNKIMKLMPVKKIVIQKQIPKIQRILITKQKIAKLIIGLTKNIDFFSNMFEDIKKTTNYLRQVEGFTKPVKQILMPNDDIERILDSNTIKIHFEIFKSEQERSQNFIQNDAILYNSLQYYNLKMEEKCIEFEKEFQQKTQNQLANRGETLKNNLNKIIEQNREKHLQTIKFLLNKRAFLPTYQKQDQLIKLQELGVNFDIHERMKDKALRSKQLISYKFGDVLNQIQQEVKK